MILNKPYTNKQYANFAIYCNQNNLIIQDNGEFLESISAPEVAITYQELRAAEYPSIGDMIDAICKKENGDNSELLELLALREQIKQKYPKE